MLSSLITILFLLIVILGGLTSWQYFKFYLKRNWRKKIKLAKAYIYPTKISFLHGEIITLCSHNLTECSLNLYRMSTTKEFVKSFNISPSIQKNIYHMWEGLAWDVNIKIESEELIPGLYFLELINKNKQNFNTVFLLRSASPHRLAVVASTNTWQAYNHFGGLSNYQDKSTPLFLRIVLNIFKILNIKLRIADRHYFPVVPLPNARPNLAIDNDIKQSDNPNYFSHLVMAESRLLRLLEQQQISYSLYSDEDFALGRLSATVSTIVFNTHSEYWSEDMISRLAQASESGKCILFLSGNNMYRKVQFLKSGIAVTEQMMDAKIVTPLIGSFYDARGYLSFAAYRIEKPNHWIFAGLGLQEGSMLGDEVTKFAPSGYEMDKINMFSERFTVLATGTNDEGAANMTYRSFVNGGWIFNCGSVSFTQAIGQCEKITTIVINLLQNSFSCSAGEGGASASDEGVSKISSSQYMF